MLIYGRKMSMKNNRINSRARAFGVINAQLLRLKRNDHGYKIKVQQATS